MIFNIRNKNYPFMHFDEDSAKIEAEIDAIAENKYIDGAERINRISQLRNSRLGGTDPSIKTVFSLTNTMIGSAIIIYPVLFVKDGIIGSTLCMIAVGCIQYVTCRLIVVHNRPDEPGLSETALRIGGKRLFKMNSVVNMLLLFFVCIAYFLLVATNFYQVSVAIILLANPDYIPPKVNDVTFKQYSMQWACILSAILCSTVLFKKEMETILKMTKYAIYCVGAYGLFIIICFIRNLVEGTIHFGDYHKFDPDFSNVAGTFALSFLLHPVAMPILKKNINFKNNERDLLYGYALTGFVYFFVGFLGGLVCAPEVTDIYKNPDSYSTIFDCLPYDHIAEDNTFYYIGKVVQLGILFQNFAVLPILVHISRKEAISIIEQPEHNNKVFIVYTLVQLISSAMVGILAINVSNIMSLDGAIIGFFIVYGIPIYIHLKCYHYKFTNKENEKRRTLLNDDSIEQSMDLDEDTLAETLQCNKHKKKSKVKHLILYSFVISVGVMLGVFKVYSFVKS